MPSPSPTARPTTLQPTPLSAEPTLMPSPSPTKLPTTRIPTASPSSLPSPSPSLMPSAMPSPSPTQNPILPTLRPTQSPTESPTLLLPTASPSAMPSPSPSPIPSTVPSPSPTALPTTPIPSPSPTAMPSPSPTPLPTVMPSPSPTDVPTVTCPCLIVEDPSNELSKYVGLYRWNNTYSPNSNRWMWERPGDGTQELIYFSQFGSAAARWVIKGSTYGEWAETSADLSEAKPRTSGVWLIHDNAGNFYTVLTVNCSQCEASDKRRLANT